MGFHPHFRVLDSCLVLQAGWQRSAGAVLRLRASSVEAGEKAVNAIQNGVYLGLTRGQGSTQQIHVNDRPEKTDLNAD